MATMTGADADALDAAAAELRGAADQLDSSAAKLTRSLGAIQWLGQVAVRFTDLWSSGHRPRLATAATFLRDNATALTHQANEQRQASNSEGGLAGSGGGGRLSGVGARAWAAAIELERLRAIAAPLVSELQRVRGLSAAEQLEWWNSLTDDQRKALLATRPGELTALGGLPADVRQQAQDNYTASISDEILTEKASVHAEIEANIKIVRVGAGFDVEERTYKDGRVELDLSGFTSAGVGDKGSKALAKAGVGAVWEFDSKADADAFIAGLKREVVPSAGEVFRSAGNVGAASVASLVGYLVQQRDHIGSVSASAGVEASVGEQGVGGGGSLSESSDVKASVDTRGEGTGDVTLSASHSYSGAMNAATLGVSGDVTVSASATFHGTNPESLTFSMDYKHAALGGVFTPVGGANAGVTHSGTAEVTFDLTRPEVQAAAAIAVAALKRGDVTGATAALSGVMDQAKITVQDMAGAQINADFDAKVVSGSVSVDTSTVASTQVKPPGGSFYEVR